MLSTLRIENSPFNEQQLRQLQSSIGSLSPVQSQWLSGYLAGRLADSEQHVGALVPAPQQAAALAIIYGTETGNSRTIATELASVVESEGFKAELHSMDNFRPAALRKLKHVAFVISTHGEGEPPEEALEFFEYLEAEQAPKLPDLNYRILALGDRSYPLFCEAGRKLDERLQELGARPFAERVECDVDYATAASVYNDEIIRFAQDNLGGEKLEGKADQVLSNHLSLVPTASSWNREQPFAAQAGKIQSITGSDSDKDIYHIELSLQGSDIKYQPGDALGVWAPNDPQVIKRLLETLQIEPTKPVRIDDRELDIAAALTDHLEITRLTTETVLGFAAAGEQNDLQAAFSQFTPGEQHAFIETRQLADLADEYPAAITAQTLVDILRPLSPRSYSIASSQGMVDDEVHLTVATLHSHATDTPRQGVASGHLNHRLKTGNKVRVFLEPNTRFRLPENPETPIIMIAAGTGIAPYRSFMQELESKGHNPDSWLIFGNPHLRSDFLYQREWLRWRKNGLLDRINTAWSRDRAKKHYVQDVVREQAVAIEDWLQRGAHIYVCGSLRMGQAVQDALQDVLIQQRDIDANSAKETLVGLRRAKRIKKDLY